MKTIYDNYWLAEDGRVFGSAAQMLTDISDADYVAWTGLGNTPIAWPRDDAGNQTNAALQDVLRPYDIFVDLTYYTASVRFHTMNGGITVNGRPFATDVVTLGSLNSAYIYSQGKSGLTFTWKLPDGTFAMLDQADIATLQSAVSKFGQDCFTCESNTLAAIDAGTITDRAAVDAAFAAVPNSFTGVTALDTKRARK